MIEDFFTTSFEINRQVWTGEISSNSLIGSFKGNIQQANPDLAEAYNTAYNRAFIISCPLTTDIKIGDLITSDTGTKEYFVKATIELAMGNIKHLEVMCEMPDNLK